MSRESGEKPKTASTGKSYVFVSYLFVALFAGMIAYMIYFQVVKSEELKNSPYNRHEELYSDMVVRGSILAVSGAEIAYTDTDADYNEYRVYPYGRLFAHVVGYSDYGSSGLEASQNQTLLQTHENLIDQVENDLAEKKTIGDNLVTSLDIKLSQAAYNALGGRKGAVLVLDADTAKVRASISEPDFDPNTVYDDWESLISDEENSPFLNRALQGLYEPGSTFKMVTALAFLKEHPNDWQDFSFDCTGEYTAGSYTMHCNGGAVHGHESLADAFANSCNCAFSYIATELLSEDALKEAAEDLKFNQEILLEVPSSESYFALDKLTKDGLSAQTAIGQGDTLASPLQMAMIAQAIYNDGILLKPSFLIGVSNRTGVTVSENKPESLGRVMGSSEATIMKQLMREVTERGTGYLLSDLPYNICGKTGTAEFSNNEGYSHSWYVGFSNTGGNDIVVAVVIEEAEQGEAPAIEVAREIFLAAFEG